MRFRLDMAGYLQRIVTLQIGYPLLGAAPARAACLDYGQCRGDRSLGAGRCQTPRRRKYSRDMNNQDIRMDEPFQSSSKDLLTTHHGYGTRVLVIED